MAYDISFENSMQILSDLKYRPVALFTVTYKNLRNTA